MANLQSFVDDAAMGSPAAVAARVTVTAVTISSGSSISVGFETDGQPIMGLQLPTAWTAAGITMQASYNGTTYGEVTNSSGTYASVVVSTSTYAAILPTEVAACYGAPYVRLRSGTLSAAVLQGGDRVIQVVTRKM